MLTAGPARVWAGLQVVVSRDRSESPCDHHTFGTTSFEVVCVWKHQQISSLGPVCITGVNVYIIANKGNSMTSVVKRSAEPTDLKRYFNKLTNKAPKQTIKQGFLFSLSPQVLIIETRSQKCLLNNDLMSISLFTRRAGCARCSCRA